MKTQEDPFVKLFGSHSRVKLLRLFLFHPKQLFSQADVMQRAKIKSLEARTELKILTDVGVLRKINGRKVRFGIDEKFPYLEALQQMLLYGPLRGNDIYERVRRSGVIKLIVLAGMFVGEFDRRIDVLVVGDRIRERHLATAMKNLEADIGREIHYATFATDDFLYRMTISDRLLRDVFDYSHRIAFNKLDIHLK